MFVGSQHNLETGYVSRRKRLLLALFIWVLTIFLYFFVLHVAYSIRLPPSYALRELVMSPLILFLVLPALPYFLLLTVPYFALFLVATQLFGAVFMRFGYVLAVLSGMACLCLEWAGDFALENPTIVHYRKWGIEGVSRVFSEHAADAAIPVFLGLAFFTFLLRRSSSNGSTTHDSS